MKTSRQQRQSTVSESPMHLVPTSSVLASNCTALAGNCTALAGNCTALTPPVSTPLTEITPGVRETQRARRARAAPRLDVSTFFLWGRRCRGREPPQGRKEFLLHPRFFGVDELLVTTRRKLECRRHQRPFLRLSQLCFILSKVGSTHPASTFPRQLSLASQKGSPGIHFGHPRWAAPASLKPSGLQSQCFQRK